MVLLDETSEVTMRCGPFEHQEWKPVMWEHAMNSERFHPRLSAGNLARPFSFLGERESPTFDREMRAETK